MSTHLQKDHIGDSEIHLDPADQAAYEELQDPDERPDGEDGPAFTDTAESQRMILGTLLHDLDFAKYYSDHIKPTAFITKFQKAIARILWDYVKKYDQLPTRGILLAEIDALVKPAKDADDILAYKVELDLCLRDISAQLDTREYIRGKLDAFARRQLLLKTANAALAAYKNPKADLDEELASLARGLSLPDRNDAGLKLQSWDELCEVADEQMDDWLIPNWAEFGCLHLFTGQPFAGKSTHVGELIALMAQGKDWHGGLPLAQVPVVLMDFENRERTLRDRILNYLGEDLGRIRELLHRVPSANLPRPLTPGSIEQVMGMVKARMGDTGSGKGVVIIDTFRTAFGDAEDFDENDQSSVGKLMRPLKALAASSGWAIIVLHHNAKSTDRYSGAGTLAAVADYLWNWRVDKDKLTGSLSCEGRADAVPPLKFQYDLRARRNVFLGTNSEVRAKTAEEAERDEESRTLAGFRGAKSETSAISAMALGERLSMSDRTAEKRCQALHAKGLLGRSGQGKRGSRYLYWLTNEGEKRLFIGSVKAMSTGSEDYGCVA